MKKTISGGDVLTALTAAGITPFLLFSESGRSEGAVAGLVDVGVLTWLHQHSQFQTGPWHALHAELGQPRAEFRSFRGCFFPDRSLQFVVNTKTGECYADLDKFSAYADVVNIFGHLFGEVIPHAVTRVWRRQTEKGFPQ